MLTSYDNWNAICFGKESIDAAKIERKSKVSRIGIFTTAIILDCVPVGRGVTV